MSHFEHFNENRKNPPVTCVGMMKYLHSSFFSCTTCVGINFTTKQKYWCNNVALLMAWNDAKIVRNWSLLVMEMRYIIETPEKENIRNRCFIFLTRRPWVKLQSNDCFFFFKSRNYFLTEVEKSRRHLNIDLPDFLAKLFASVTGTITRWPPLTGCR